LDPEVSRYQKDANTYIEKEPPDIFRWIEHMLDQSEAMNFEKKDQYFNCLQNFKMPIAYKTTKNIC